MCSRYRRRRGSPRLPSGETQTSRGATVETSAAGWDSQTISRVARISTPMRLLRGPSSAVRGTNHVLARINVRVSDTLMTFPFFRDCHPCVDGWLCSLHFPGGISRDFGPTANLYVDVMHWITETPTNLQAFGLCSKDSQTTLRLADGTNIVTTSGFTGGWPDTGGDVGRYTP